VVQSYIDELLNELKELKGEEPAEEPMEEEPKEGEEKDEEMSDEPPFPPVYESGDDYDMASNLKQDAADFKSTGQWEQSLEKYTEAVQAAPPSALLYANRAMVLLKLGRPRAAERDCDLALKENPDSAKALRVRGKARKELEKWEEALADLSAAQTIDFDEETVEDLKFLTEKHVEMEKVEAAQRIEKEEKLKKRASEIKKAQEEAKAGKARAPAGGFPGGMPGGGMPAGMESMMAAMMSDPELVAAVQNPKVQAALQNPAKIPEMMNDPEVGPILQKLMSKMAGGMPGAGAPPAEDDGIPNLDEMEGEVDLDDLPDLE
jgi:suppressor of tumorigenicity protein 13